MNRRAMLPPPARHDLGLEPVLVHQPVGFQLDEPYLEARTDRARAYAIPVIDRALAGLARPTCVHLCFGYPQAHAQAGTTKVGGYAFLPELARCTARQVSIEAAQLHSKTIVLGVLDGPPARGRPGPPAGRAARGGARLRHEISFADRRLRQAAGPRRGREASRVIATAGERVTAAHNP